MTLLGRGRAPGSGAAVRLPSDGLLVLAGLALLVLSSLWVDEHHLSAIERGVFRAVNGLPSVIYRPMWVFMQLGNFLVVPAAVLVALIVRKWRLAAGLLLGGLITYGLAKVVKRIVTRGRPITLLDDIHIHGTPSYGLGFVSGHAAVVATLITIAWPWLSRPARIVVVVLGLAVCVGRVYVGAHFPLDIVGGVGLGVAVGGLVRLILGRPAAGTAEPAGHTG